MGIAYRVDIASGLIVVVADGEITRDDFHTFAQRQADDPRWHAATRSITDASSVHAQPVRTETLASFAKMYAEMRSGDRPMMAAIVAGREFEQASKYGEIRSDDGSRTIAFSSLVTACTWLGVDLGTTGLAIGELRKEMRAPAAAPDVDPAVDPVD